MLRAVLVGFLSSLPNERAFDEPFKALLRQLGFYDIHLLHGAFEFGKDFIAKKDTAPGPEQWVFQTKAGNIGKSEWQGIRNQLEEIRTNTIGHPNLDPDQPPIPVLVFTGRLVGQAATSAQQYNEWLEKTAQPKVEHWNGDRLLDLFLDPASAFVETSADGELLGLVGDIDADRCGDRRIEQFSRRWMTEDTDGFGASTLEAAVVSARLAQNGRLDLACLSALALLRGIWWTAHHANVPADRMADAAAAAREIFALHAEALWQTCTEDHLDPLYFINVHQEPTAFATYPVRCARLVELLGLLALLRRSEGDTAADDAITDYLAKFMTGQPGVRHLLSDHWAASLIPAVLAIAPRHPDLAHDILRDLAKWVGDQQEHGLGLAAPWAEPIEEIERVVGASLEHITHDHRRVSYLGTVLLDLAAILDLADLYEDIKADLRAVDACLAFVHAKDTAGHADLYGADARRELDVQYRPQLEHPVAPHHIKPVSHRAVREDQPWDLLAIQSVVRDRHFLNAIRSLAA